MSLIILPNQLYDYNIIKKEINNYEINNIYIIEEPRYFSDFKFHKLKLAYHRATMKKYYDDIIEKFKLKSYYIDYDTVNDIYNKIKKNNIYIFDMVDYKLEEKYNKLFKKLIILDTPNFIMTRKEVKYNIKEFYNNKTNKYYHDKFYKFQRKRLNILIDNNKPTGGKWSYDNMNRDSLTKDITIPKQPKKIKSNYITEAIKYVNKNFKDNYGSMENFIYPIDRKSSLSHLKKFLKYKLNNYGKYQDAVDSEYPFVFHSILSPMMNIGLITDMDVINISNKYYLKNKDNVPINSYEGFIRQVIGWRNYVYSLYILEGKKMYNSNKMNHNNKLSNKWWEGNTGIVVIDNIILKNIVPYAYSHHIERLMYLGNILLMLMVHPKEVHRIFMEWTIDSYDWVMVPNVMGMSQHSDGGIMMTRPYFASSNYISKMSNYRKNKNNDWHILWDTIYYNFINNHRNYLKSNYATSRMVVHWDKKSKKEQEDIKKKANKLMKEIL